MIKPQKRRRPGGEDGAVNLTKCVEPATSEGEAHQTDDIRKSWAIEPDGHDGFNVSIIGKGHIQLTQHAPFSNEVEIILHPDEARKLTTILSDAIDAAEFLRNGGYE